MEEITTATLGTEVGAAPADPAQNPEGQQQETLKTYTEAELNAEADRRATKAAQTAIENFKQKELKGIIENAKTEAEQLAKMTAEQKAEHERKQQERTFAEEKAALEKRAQEITKHELKIEAHKTLVEKKLPVELLEVLQYTDAEACNSSIVSVEKAFRAAVEDEVNKRFKGNPPPAIGGTGNEKETIANAARAAMGIK